MAKLASEMTPAERLEYEREVQAQTGQAMEIGQPGFAYELRAVELEGSSLTRRSLSATGILATRASTRPNTRSGTR
jgi:hypothetical protein